MFLHLGGDVVISLNSIICIINYSEIEKAKDTQVFLRVAEEEGFVKKVGNGYPKSCVITEQVKRENKGREKNVQTVIYYSPISSITLQKRANVLENIYTKYYK